MSIAANRSPHVLAPEAAQETLREMAAVIRTIFGVGLQASRVAAAAAPAPAVAAAPATGPQPIALAGVPVSPASIPMPAIPVPGLPVPGLPVPGIAVPDLSVSDPTDEIQAPADVAAQFELAAELDDTPTFDAPPAPSAATVEVPSEPVPDFPTLATTDERHRNALLQEIAFLDD